MPDTDADVEYVDFAPAPKRTRRTQAEIAADKGTTKSIKTRASSKSVVQSNTAGMFAKLLVIITAIFAWQRIRSLGIPDPDSELSEELAMTDDEAAPVARVLARVTLSNPTTAKIVKPLVANEDLIDAGFALWEWNKRVNAVLARYSRTIVQEVPNNVSTRPNQSSESSGDGGPSGDESIPDFFYNGNADYRAAV